MPRKKKLSASMFCVVEQGGCQFTVTQGDTIKVPLIEAPQDAEISLDRVLLVREGDAVKVGTPQVEGVQVRAKVVNHGKDRKVLVMKKRRRKDYRRKNGHRQPFTQIQITSITA